MSTVTPRVFISYNHTDITKARKIEEDLVATGIQVIRDERALGYTQDLASYMKKIRVTDYALILVSDAFLRSTNCMSEINEFLKDENYKDRILPVILNNYTQDNIERKGANIYSSEGPADYVHHWQECEAKLRKKLNTLDISNMEHFARELRLIQNITKTVADFVFMLKQIKHTNFDDLLKSEYREVLEKIGISGIGTGDVRRAISLYSQAIGQVNLEYRFKYLNEAINTYPLYVEALCKRAQIFDELKDYQSALRDYEKALSLAPERAATYICRSYAYIRIGKFKDALSDLEKAIALDPHHKEAFNNRADVYRRLGRFDEAIQDARHALNIDQNFDLAYATLAEIAASQGNQGDFLKYLTESVNLGFPLHKYAFDDVYEQYKDDKCFQNLLHLSKEKNQRFL